jgi:hypothetical protein
VSSPGRPDQFRFFLERRLNTPGIPGAPFLEEAAVMSTSKRYSPEVRERAVPLVFEHEGEHNPQWAAIGSIAAKLGCTAETLRGWAPQDLSIRYSERLAEAGIDPSMGRVGDSYDNALAETSIGLSKTEIIHQCGPWRHLEAVEYANLEWVGCSIGNVPPAELELACYRQQHEWALAA